MAYYTFVPRMLTTPAPLFWDTKEGSPDPSPCAGGYSVPVPFYLVGVLVFLWHPTELLARVVKWEGKPLTALISTERLTRIDFPETPRCGFISRSDIAAEKEDRSILCWQDPETNQTTISSRSSSATRGTIFRPLSLVRSRRPASARCLTSS